MKRKAAIIGGGIAGLTAAYLLNSRYDISLFEKDERVGGNAHTISTEEGLTFDIAVAVFGRRSYPNFKKLLKELGVEICYLSGNGFGWRNLDTDEAQFIVPTLRGTFATKFYALRPRIFSALVSAMRNMRRGKRMYEQGKLDGLTMQEAYDLLPPFRENMHYLHQFVMCVVSSMYYDEVMEAPAPFFFGKMSKHSDFFENPLYGMFQARGNTISYVKALASHFEDKIVLNSRIRSVARDEGGALLNMEDGSQQRFDKLVFACNPDQALKLLEKPTAEEETLLGPWAYKDGPIVVHTDRRCFPAEYDNLFTFIYTNRDGKIHTSVNGHIRALRRMPNDCKIISSQHPNFPIDEDRIKYSRVFRTPIYTKDSVATIRELPSLNGTANTFYCGSYFGYGLHEDAVSSAVKVAERLGVEWK